MYEVSNSTWDYCVIIPSSSVRQEQGRLFGVGPDADWTKAYDNAFGISDNVYKILTLCLLEVSFSINDSSLNSSSIN